MYFEVDWREICLKVRKKYMKNLYQPALDRNQIPPKYVQFFIVGHENANAGSQGVSELSILSYTFIINII
jgi:hypothetical protein